MFLYGKLELGYRETPPVNVSNKKGWGYIIKLSSSSGYGTGIPLVATLPVD